MKLWVDDERPAPEGWYHALTSDAAIDILWINHSEAIGEKVTEISLDHDLGGDDTTRRVVMWMAEHDIWPEIIHVHTANPVGREWLEGMINRYGPGVTR